MDQKAEERSMSLQADGIRRHALEHHVRPWRESGASVLSIRLLALALHERGITIHVPMEGLRSGEQLAQLNAWIIP